MTHHPDERPVDYEPDPDEDADETDVEPQPEPDVIEQHPDDEDAEDS